MIYLNPEGISDSVVRENFEKLTALLKSNPFLSGEFKLIEEVVTKPSATYRIKHLLGFEPTDVLITWVSKNSGVVTVNYELTDKDFLILNINQALTVRLLIGRIPKRREP